LGLELRNLILQSLNLGFEPFPSQPLRGFVAFSLPLELLGGEKINCAFLMRCIGCILWLRIRHSFEQRELQEFEPFS
jgi:hypothetical protein